MDFSPLLQTRWFKLWNTTKVWGVAQAMTTAYFQDAVGGSQGSVFLLIGFAPSEALLVSFSSLWTTLLVPSCTCYCGLVPFSAHTLIGAAQQNNEYQRAWWQQMKTMTESQDLLGFLSLSWAMSLARPAPILANNRPLALVVDLRQVTKMEDKI